MSNPNSEQPKKNEPEWSNIFKCDAQTAWNAYAFLMRDLGYTEQTIKLKSPTFHRLLERCFPDFNQKGKVKSAKEGKTKKDKKAKK